MKIATLGRSRTPNASVVAVTALVTGAGLSLAACGPGVATPIPEPPTLQLGRIGPPEEPKAESSAAGGRHIYGNRGAAPVGATLRVTNLDRTDPASVSMVESDGSFDISVVVEDGEELRFDWSRGDERGAPQDARFVKDPSYYHVLPSERFACLTLTPGFVVDFGMANQRILSLDNGCASSESLTAPRLRRGLPNFSLPSALPVSLAPSDSVPLELTATHDRAATTEDTLFFDVTSDGKAIRYPITLLASPVP